MVSVWKTQGAIALIPDNCFIAWSVNGCSFDIVRHWSAMDWLTRADVFLLGLMLVNTIAILCLAFFRYSLTRWQSRNFVRDAAAALREGKVNEALAVAARNRLSHVASVVSAGLTAFATAPPEFPHAEAIASAERAFQRNRNMLVAELRFGLSTLSIIASSAPLIGLVGTVNGILDAFTGGATERSTLLARVTFDIGNALLTTAMGLLVAVPALWCRNYLRNRVEIFESEMKNAALQAVAYLHAHPQWRNLIDPDAGGSKNSIFDMTNTPAQRSWEAPYDRPWALFAAMWCCVFYVAFLFGRGLYLELSYTPPTYEANYYSDVSPGWELVGGQELVSPDGRYRAVVPVISREKTFTAGKNSYRHWSCGSDPVVALHIFPNDRSLTWKRFSCQHETRYTLETTEALLTWNCTVPAILWRKNDELLVQCGDCSVDDLQRIKPDFFPHRITVIDARGKPIHPGIVHPEPQCLE